MLLLAVELSSSGQDLSSVADVVALKPMDASRSPRNVKLRGVVTEVSPARNSFTMQEGEDAVGVKLAEGATCPALGDDIECEGATYAHVQANYMHAHVLARSVSVKGRGIMPKPRPLKLLDLNSYRYYEQWVSVEGHVLKWKFNRASGELTFTITNENLWTTIVARTQSRPDLLDRFMGARVRVTGINSGKNTHDMNGALIVPSMEHLEVLAPGTSGTFDAPLVPMKDVARGKLTPGARVKVRGVVVSVWNFRLYVRGENGGALVNTLQNPWNREAEAVEEYGDAGPRPDLKYGTEVELVGSPPMTTGYGMNYGDVRIIGQAKVADPERLEIEKLKAFENQDDWVSIDGVVSAWSLQNNLMAYSVRGPRDTLIVTIPDVTVNSFPKDLHGAHLRFTGVAIRWSGGTNFFVPGLPFAEILKPGRENPFDAPLRTATDVLQRRVPLVEPMKLKGLLVGRSDKSTLYVRCADSALCVKLRSPLPRSSGNSERHASDAATVPALTVGDELEFVAWPAPVDDKAASDVVDADVRIVGHHDRVTPVTATLAKVAAGELASDFAELRGRLLSLNQVSVNSGEWRSTLLLESGGVRLPVVLQSAGRPSFDSLHVDDELVVHAVVGRASKGGPPELLLATSADVRSLGISPDVKRRQMWIWGSGVAVVFAVLVAWIAVLRRSSRIQREATAMLEQRVNERTVDLQKAQSDLQRALEQERELSELKTRFVSMVSHEFRTPLGIIMSAVELLQHYSDRLPEDEKRRQLQEIQSGTKHMGDLMEQVLLLGRAEAGKLTCKPQPLDLAVFSARIIDEALSISDRKCPIALQIEDDLSGACADEALLRHVFRNLVVNAVKYSPAGSEVRLRIRRDGKAAVFEVIDRGIGVPEKDRARLFEAFHRCSNVGDTPGTGLGLVIVKRCVDLHGGTIDLESEPGIGTTFIVRLTVFS